MYRTTALLILTTASLAAHEGHHHAAGFLDGALHPLTGIDHLLALGAAAVLAARGGRRALPALVGFLAAFAIGTQLPGLAGGSWELLVWAGSAALILSAIRRPGMATLCAVTVPAGLAHGVPHGAELAAAAPLAGAVLAVALVAAAGFAYRALFAPAAETTTA